MWLINGTAQNKPKSMTPKLWRDRGHVGRVWLVECGRDMLVKMGWAHSDDWDTTENASCSNPKRYEVMKT